MPSLLDVAQARGKSVIRPHGIADDPSREAEAFDPGQVFDVQHEITLPPSGAPGNLTVLVELTLRAQKRTVAPEEISHLHCVATYRQAVARHLCLDDADTVCCIGARKPGRAVPTVHIHCPICRVGHDISGQVASCARTDSTSAGIVMARLRSCGSNASMTNASGPSPVQTDPGFAILFPRPNGPDLFQRRPPAVPGPDAPAAPMRTSGNGRQACRGIGEAGTARQHSKSPRR